MPRHSLGPWEYNSFAGSVCDAQGRSLVATEYATDADCRVIAAAPEMLQMLRDIVDSPDATEFAAARRLIARLDNG